MLTIGAVLKYPIGDLSHCVLRVKLSVSIIGWGTACVHTAMISYEFYYIEKFSRLVSLLQVLMTILTMNLSVNITTFTWHAELTDLSRLYMQIMAVYHLQFAQMGQEHRTRIATQQMSIIWLHTNVTGIKPVTSWPITMCLEIHVGVLSNTWI